MSTSLFLLLRQMPELNNNANSVTIGFVLTDAVKKKINFLKDPALGFEKMGPVSELNFETAFALRKMRDEEIKQNEYNRLVKEMKTGVLN